jgi:glycosyltransferase involved in cell wall biosynthesis
MNKKETLTIAMIVKNEEKDLPRCLDSIKGVDEIVICDTGSTDKTVEIAKKYTKKVYTDYKWNNHFAEARNYANSKCTKDWIMVIDADDYLKTPIEEVYKALKRHKDKDAISIKLISSNSFHFFPNIFKNDPKIKWEGAAHNYVTGIKNQAKEEGIQIVRGYSPTHKKNPDRTLNILKEDVAKNPNKSREKFYLAREYFYRKDYITAIWWYNEYLKGANWKPEIAEAYLMIAKCYWKLMKGEDARMMCMHAIRINPDFKEALQLMGTMHYEPMKSKWLEYSRLATNKGVLFIRNQNIPEPIEVCIVTYQRPERIPILLQQLKEQTTQKFRVNIWNNSGKKLEIDSKVGEKVKVFESVENVGSAARFILAKETTGNPIIFIDDDQSINNNFIQYYYDQFKRYGGILGCFTRIFDKNYWNSIKAKHGEEVDYVGTGAMIFDRKILEEESLQNIPEQFKKAEDLYMSYIARKKGIRLTKIDPASHDIQDEKNQYKELINYKEKAFKELRKKGWRLLKDRVKLYSSSAGNGKNFGDLITKRLIEDYVEKDVEIVGPDKAEVFGAGSVLQRVPEDYSGIIIGTGTMYESDRVPDLKNATVLGVRGPLTAEKAKISALYFDLGILAYLYAPKKIVKKYKKGYLPHFKLYKKTKGKKVIDILSGIENVVKEVSECEKLVCSSLHAVILADSLGIPREVVLEKEVEGDGYKFKDYEESLKKYSVEEMKKNAWNSLMKLKEI